MVLTTDQRVHALMDFGFTERQARFLELVLRHAGVCVPRQYARFARVAHGGARCNTFFARLVRRGYGAAGACLHNRGRVYHVHSKRLYCAIAEPNSGFRRSMPPRLTIERLMWLDAVLASPNLMWLTTDGEKSALFASIAPHASVDAPDATLADGAETRLIDFSGLRPIGLDPSGRVVLFYLATVPWTEEFRRFLQRLTPVLRFTRAWTLRLVFPRPIDQHYSAYQAVIRQELETPLEHATIRELKVHFERRRAAAHCRSNMLPEALPDRRAEFFEGPRFTLLYRRWLKDGDAALEALSSTVIADALASGNGREECLVLPHTYRHLIPLVACSDSTPERVEKRLRSRTRGGKSDPHVLNRGAQPGTAESQWSISEQSAPD